MTSMVIPAWRSSAGWSRQFANHVRQNGLDARVRLHSYVPQRQIRRFGIPEIIRHGFNGYLVDPGDARQLALTLDTLMGDQGLRRQLRDNCRNRTPIASYGDLAQRLVR
jgi:hypothetical protein